MAQQAQPIEINIEITELVYEQEVSLQTVNSIDVSPCPLHFLL